jgi:hypothetical protein
LQLQICLLTMQRNRGMACEQDEQQASIPGSQGRPPPVLTETVKMLRMAASASGRTLKLPTPPSSSAHAPRSLPPRTLSAAVLPPCP